MLAPDDPAISSTSKVSTKLKIRNPCQVLGLLNTRGVPLVDIATEFDCNERYVRNILVELRHMGHAIQIFENRLTGRTEARIHPNGWEAARIAAEAYYERTCAENNISLSIR